MFWSRFWKHDGRHFSDISKRKKEEQERTERERERKKELANLMTEKTRRERETDRFQIDRQISDRQTDSWVDHWPCQKWEMLKEHVKGQVWLKDWVRSNKFNLIFSVEKMNVFFKIICLQNVFSLFCLHNARRCDFNRNFSISSNRTAARFQLVENAPQCEIVCWNRASKRYLRIGCTYGSFQNLSWHLVLSIYYSCYAWSTWLSLRPI